MDEGADAIEIDVQLTRDQELVIFHDRDMKRMLGLDRSIGDCTLREIKNFRLGSNKLEIPTLREVLDEFSGKIDIVLEIKPQVSDPEFVLEDKILDCLSGSRGLGDGYISVRSVDTFEYVRDHDSHKIGLMQKKRKTDEYHRLLRENSIRIAQTRINEYNDEKYGELGEIVDEINVFYADDVKTWRYLVNAGITGILTNYPGACRKFLQGI